MQKIRDTISNIKNNKLIKTKKLLKKLPSNPVFPPFLIAVSLPLQPFKFRK